MNSLDEVISYIVNARVPLECVAVDARMWERLRDECREMCEDMDEKFSSDPTFFAPNFLVMGIPIIAAGRA